MPIYEFRCRECSIVFERLRPMGDDGSDLTCPECGASRPEKKMSSFAAGACGTSPGGSGFG